MWGQDVYRKLCAQDQNVLIGSTETSPEFFWYIPIGSVAALSGYFVVFYSSLLLVIRPVKRSVCLGGEIRSYRSTRGNWFKWMEFGCPSICNLVDRILLRWLRTAIAYSHWIPASSKCSQESRQTMTGRKASGKVQGTQISSLFIVFVLLFI